MSNLTQIAKYVGKPSEQPPLSWMKMTIDDITIKSPNGHVGSLGHDVDAQGIVSPSIVCPGRPAVGTWPEQTCDFHVWAQLEGWEG